MSLRRTALTLAFAACALGCEARETSGRARLWTLFDLVSIAAHDGKVAADGGIMGGLRAAAIVAPLADQGAGTPSGVELVETHGFLDGLPMTYVTTEIWANMEQIWAQPLYRAIRDDGTILDDALVNEPWVFSVGPESLFYSPFWQVFGFKVPPGVDVTTLLDTRAVLEAANQTGGLRGMEGRITTLAPATVSPPAALVEAIYLDDTAAWNGRGGGRYLDLGPGRFDYSVTAVVREFPIFIFTKRNAQGLFAPVPGWPAVGASHQLFSAPPPLGSSAGGATGGTTGTLEPAFGGLWRIYTVDLDDSATLDSTGRVVTDQTCLSAAATPCVVLDSQTAVEALGPDTIHRTEVAVSCPMLQLGEQFFGVNEPHPLPGPSP